MNKKYEILIADDEPFVLNLIEQILLDENYTLIKAINGKQVLQYAEENIPDLIILDWNMPGMNGLEALKILKKRDATKDIPVIMITGIMDSLENLKEAFDAGAIDYIRKPIEPVELVSRTRSMLMLADYYKQTIIHKDWELTLLAKNVLRNSELNINLLEKMEQLQKKLSPDDQQLIKIVEELITELKYNIKEQAWDHFESYYKSVHPKFVENLLIKYPKLTPTEVKLCVLLRLNMNSKEIASITFQNSHSVDIARYRIRKKMGLSRQQKLASALMAI